MALSQRTLQSIPMRGARKGEERGGKEKTWPHRRGSLALELCKLCCFYPKSSSFHTLCCKLLLTHQVQASVSHLQKHFLILHPVNTTRNISSSHSLAFPSKNLNNLQQWPCFSVFTTQASASGQQLRECPTLSVHSCPGPLHLASALLDSRTL